MFKDFFDGIKAYRRALQLIPELGLWGYVLAPGLISVLLGAGIVWGAISIADDIGGWLLALYPFEWGRATLGKIANVFSGLLVVVLGLIIFKNLVLALSSPIMSPLSEKVERALTQASGPVKFSIARFFRDLLRGIRISIRLIVRELFFTIIVLILGLFPLFAPFAAGILFFIQSYYGGAGNIDFALERHFGVRDSVRFVHRNRALALGNGVVYILLLLSGIGFIVALPLGVIAATAETVKRLDALEHRL
ncbi:MAG TPA: EI24 domain-containing protein [Saprospiraceae bacterium]|nr:EI24 domain-containing protein [Saprospiraceae bacterium]HMP25665.1 EI24 domain-containing protein [Saprospiraceae bacterium]